jgi:hypothetical protein
VRDDDGWNLEVAHVALEPLDGIEVEVVRRLVEQQHVGVLQQDLAEAHAHLPAAGVLAHLPAERAAACAL